MCVKSQCGTASNGESSRCKIRSLRCYSSFRIHYTDSTPSQGSQNCAEPPDYYQNGGNLIYVVVHQGIYWLRKRSSRPVVSARQLGICEAVIINALIQVLDVLSH